MGRVLIREINEYWILLTGILRKIMQETRVEFYPTIGRRSPILRIPIFLNKWKNKQIYIYLEINSSNY